MRRKKMSKSDRREPILMIATGKKGVGKSYTTFKYIIEYQKEHPDRNVLIFDPNDEYGIMKPAPEDKEGMRIYGGKPYKVRAIDLRHIVQFSAMRHLNQVRRVRVFHSFDVIENKPNKKIIRAKAGSRMNHEFVVKSIKHVLENFSGGLLLIEDLSKIFGDSIPREVMGLITSNRHADLDIIFHIQSVGPILPRFWQNTQFTRYHKQLDDIDKSKEKLEGKYQMYKIVEYMVNSEYKKGNKRFYVFVDNDEAKVTGDYTKEQFMDAITMYIKQNPSVLRYLMQEEDDHGKRIYKKPEAIEIMKKQLFEEYYGN